MNGRATLTLLVVCVHLVGCSNYKEGDMTCKKKKAKKCSKWREAVD